jgi:hypothetical protein
MGTDLSRRAAAALLAVLATTSVARSAEPSGTGGPSGERRPSYQTATGTLAAYDPVTRVLTVRNAAGTSEFHVAADARVWLGSRRLPVSELGAHPGAEVTVAWAEVDGVRTTHTVRLEEPRAARGR